jgi:Uma2 family endonuclease
MTAALKLPTFDDLYAEIAALPEGVTGEILEPGVLRTMSRPGKRHRRAARLVLHGLGDFDANVGGRGWWIEIEPEIRLGDRLVVPDLAGWRVERVPELPDENPLTLVPDWTCEVLSPSTQRDDRVIKLPLYAREGVAHVWLVDPALRAVEVYEAERKRPLLAQTATDDDTLVLAPFDKPVTLTAWWLPTSAAG